MILVRIKVFKNTGDSWVDQCTGIVSQIHGDMVVVEDEMCGDEVHLPLCGRQCYKSEDTALIVHADDEEYAVCFETEDMRDRFIEFVELSDRCGGLQDTGCSGGEENYFVVLARTSRYMEESVFEEMMCRKEDVLRLLGLRSFHMFKRLLRNSERIFRLFGIPFKGQIAPQTFYMELMSRETDEETTGVYERFLIILNRQELMRREAKVHEMSDEEVKNFLKRCCSSFCKVGGIEMYVDRIHGDNEHFPETFYYLCQIFKGKASRAVDPKVILNKIQTLLTQDSTGDEVLYILEGLYTLLDSCEGEWLDIFYMGLSGLFDDIEYHPDMQRLLQHLFSTNDFRTREFLINTGLLRKIFELDPPDARVEMFMAKMLRLVSSCGNRYMHSYFIKHDLLRNTVHIYRNRSKDATYSILLQAFSQADGELKRYFDRCLVLP